MRSINCVVVGDSATNKTSLIKVFMESKPPTKLIPTIFEHTSAKLHVHNKEVFLNIIDTSGFSEYDQLRSYSYMLADVVIICFSLVKPTTLENVKSKWFPEVRRNRPQAYIFLIGTRSDLREKQPPMSYESKVALRDGLLAAKDINAIKYYECSTMSPSTVKNAFQIICETIWNLRKW